jgi:hypothetical protein
MTAWRGSGLCGVRCVELVVWSGLCGPGTLARLHAVAKIEGLNKYEGPRILSDVDF